MDYRKETFLNTEELMLKNGRRRTVFGSLPSAKRVGGVRFYSDAKSEVELSLVFSDLSGSYTPYIDGVPVAEKRSPVFRSTFFLEKGAHIFDVTTDGSHKGAAIEVSGAAIRANGGYIRVLGSAYLPTKTIAFLKLGERKIEKYERSNNQTTLSDMSVSHIDAAYYYDRTLGAYSSDLVLLSATTDSAVNVITGDDVKTISVSGLKSCALIDGFGLTSGKDYIAAIVDSGGVMKLYAFSHGGTPAQCNGSISGVTEVKSASRGSLLLYANKDGVWKAMQFRSGGLYSLVCGANYMAYDLLTVTQNKLYAPTCNVEVDMRYPFFYCKKDSGALVKRDVAGEETLFSYADAYVPGAFQGFSISENDVSYTS